MTNIEMLRNRRDALKSALENIESELMLADRRAQARDRFDIYIEDETYTMDFVRVHILPLFADATWELEDFDQRKHRDAGGETVALTVSNGSGIEIQVTIEMCSDLD